MKHSIIIICGPTGIGKTSFAIKLAQHFSGEIINADSMQIYKYMNIGTAKPDKEEQNLVPHHLIDIIPPNQPFDAANFAEMADKKIDQIIKQNKLPFVVGGTGLYIKALTYGLFRAKPVDSGIIEDLSKKESTDLFKELEKCDPEYAKKIHPNDKFRIIRALEVFNSTGKTLSEYHNTHGFKEKRYNYLMICLNMDRQLLYERINKRVDHMIEQNLIKEVKELLDKGYKSDLKSMRSIGYKHINDYLQNKYAWDETIRLWKQDTRRYAKRQLTWFRAVDDIIWVENDNINKAKQLIANFTKH